MLVGQQEEHPTGKSPAIRVFMAHHDSMVAACSPQVRNTVIVREGKPEGKAAHATIAVSLTGTYFSRMEAACCL